jgi:hypothetical protein
MADDHTLMFEVRAALEGAGCPVCLLAQRSLRRYLSALANEGVTDRQQRDEIRAAYGFCAAHGRMMRDGRDALGSAIIQRDMLANLSRALVHERPTPPNVGARLRRALRPSGRANGPLPTSRSCVACEQVIQAEQRYAAALVGGLIEPQTLALFRASAGLCVPHLRLALLSAPNPEAHTRLRETQGTIWGDLIGELDEFIRKQDHRFTHEPPGPEANSWRRAIDLVSGQPECPGND